VDNTRSTYAVINDLRISTSRSALNGRPTQPSWVPRQMGRPDRASVSTGDGLLAIPQDNAPSTFAQSRDLSLGRRKALTADAVGDTPASDRSRVGSRVLAARGADDDRALDTKFASANIELIGCDEFRFPSELSRDDRDPNIRQSLGMGRRAEFRHLMGIFCHARK
jgi:hypothetical protein